MNRWIVHLRQSLRGIWFPAALFTVAGLALALAAHFLGWLIPAGMSEALGTDSTASILEILASSMLAVTTFSLTTMVSAYSTATQIGTPRSIQLLVADRTSHNALSTFIGAFAFAIVGIVALSANVYSQGGETFLFLGTILVIVTVLITLLRWIAFLTTFGRMSDIIDRVEKAASQAMREYTHNPLLGARPWVTPPASAVPVICDGSGFVVNVDVATLQHVAQQENCVIWVNRRAGSRIFEGHPAAYVSTDISQEAQVAVQRAFTIANHRTFDQDPRLGLIALSEIASRALSPAVNDPGTAIEVLSAIHRVLSIAINNPPQRTHDAPLVYMKPLDHQDLVHDAFRPISRDGAATVEVAMRLQKNIGALITTANTPWTTALRDQAVDSFHRTQQALQHPSDLNEVERLHYRALSSRATHTHHRAEG